MRESDLVGGRYRILAPLGQGGMAQVFRARDERLQREVAVKIVDLTSSDPGSAERFHREAIATARLNHPGIVTIFDAGSDGHSAYLVMELLPGRSVAEILRDSGPFAPREAVRIAGRVAQALVATHAIGVVHRDIKPANIMVGDDFVKLLDFGIALLVQDAESHLTAPATTLGTAAYMSPEQARGERATPASDVYALGGVLMAMLTGRPPFPGDQAVQVAGRHITEAPPVLADLRPDAGASLSDLVARMLAKDPAARPRTVDVATALSHLELNLGSSAATSPMPPAPAGRTAVLPAGGTAVLPAGGPPPPTAPGSAQRAATGPDPGGSAGSVGARRFKRAAAWIAVIIVAILVLMIGWAFGRTLFVGLGTGATASPAPAASASPSPRSTPSGWQLPSVPLPTITMPEVTMPSIPGLDQAGLRTAVAGVDAALNLINTDRSTEAARAASDLKDSWSDASADILAGNRAQRALASFADEVSDEAADGSITWLEEQTINAALQAVRAAL